jgi:hypothetical protein
MDRRAACRGLACAVLIAGLGACSFPVRQFDLKHQQLTCEQANEYAYHTLQTMGFTITRFEPAAAGRPGTIRGTREEQGTQNVTVKVTCGRGDAEIDASEDGKFLGQLEFKRGFYLAFTATAAQAAVSAAVAREQAERPLAQKNVKGLQVLLEPVGGLGAKLDFDLDLAAAGVLPVRVTINNFTTRTYIVDPTDIVLAQKDGTRVGPMTVAETAQRIEDAGSREASGSEAAVPDTAEVTRRLQARLLRGHTVSANQIVKGYLFYPLAAYVKGRATLEDQESEETEGFVVEF